MTRLKELRKALGLKQVEMAQQLGVTRPTYSLFENGKKELQTKYINLICATYKVSEEWLLYGKGDMFVSASCHAEMEAILNRLLPQNRQLLSAIAQEILKAQQSSPEKKDQQD